MFLKITVHCQLQTGPCCLRLRHVFCIHFANCYALFGNELGKEIIIWPFLFSGYVFLNSLWKAKIEDTVELLLIGYIWMIQSMENTSQALSITDDYADQATTWDALDLPAFSMHWNS